MNDFTEYNEGFLSYLCGEFLHQNPYSCVAGQEKEYCLWYDGWNDALQCYPEHEPKED